jgi:hypothetical protein
MTPVRRVMLLGAMLVTFAGCYVVQPVSPAPPPAQGWGRWVWTGRAWVWQPGAPGPAGQAAPAPPPPPPRAENAPAAPAAGQNCRTVLIEAHPETHVMPDGQRVTVQVPAHQRQMCQ